MFLTIDELYLVKKMMDQESCSSSEEYNKAKMIYEKISIFVLTKRSE